jgi:osmotically-inducible protein OsmY
MRLTWRDGGGGQLLLEGGSGVPVLDAAGRVVGVVSEADLLVMQTDRTIVRAVRAALDTALSEPDAVRVSVVEGVVTLDGEVDAQPEIEAAVVRVEAMPGVVGVESRLRATV